MNLTGYKRFLLGLAAMSGPIVAWAQGLAPAVTPGPESAAPTAPLAGGTPPKLLQRLYEMLGVTGIVVIVVILLVVIIGAIAFFVFSRRGGDELEESLPEPETAERSKFEQVLAEVQGISLRIQGGDSKGYYRKIEQLARIYLERLGFTGARDMSAPELDHILSGGALPPKQAATLSSIIERCRQGAEHESKKQDITTADLLRDLRALIKQTEETPSTRPTP